MKEHVALIIKNVQEKILFIQRSLDKKTLPGAWSFPSGTLESQESPEQTAIREAQEELGIEITPQNIIAETTLPEFNVKLIFLNCIISSGIPQIKQPEEIAKIDWLTFSDFFQKFSDEQIGHGLIWLRKNPEVWSKNDD